MGRITKPDRLIRIWVKPIMATSLMKFLYDIVTTSLLLIKIDISSK